MKSLSYRFLGRCVLVVIAIGVAYYLGHWYQFSSPVRANSTPPSLADLLAGAHFPPRPPFLTTAEARDRLTQVLAGNLPPGVPFKEAWMDLLKNVNPSDVPDLIAMLHGLPASDYNSQLMFQLLRILKDPEAAISLAGNIPDVTIRANAYAEALSKVLQQDPQKALAEMAQLPTEDDLSAAYRNVFRLWGMTNPTEAANAVAQLPAGLDRDKAIMGIVDSWGRANPQAALQWTLSLGASNPDIFRSLFLQIAGKDPFFAADNLSQVTDPTARNTVIGYITNSMTRASPTEALDWLAQVATGTTYDNNVKAVFTQVAKTDPATGATLLDKVTNPADRSLAITQLAGVWGGTDPKAALAWAQTLPPADGTNQARALNTIVNQWSKSDPLAALSFVQNSPDPSTYLSSATTLAKAVAASDPQDALTFVQSLPDSTTKSQALNNVLTTEAQSNFTDAWNVATSLPPGDNQNTILTNLVGVQASKDPAQAAALLNQFPDPTTQLAATSTLSATWVKQDPQAFTTWLDSLPAGDVRDTAITQLVSSSQATKNPVGVLQWVNTVSNPQTKATLLQTLNQAQSGGK